MRRPRTSSEGLKVYPLSQADNPPAMEFISGSGKSFNTIHANDFTFYPRSPKSSEREPVDLLDPELRGRRQAAPSASARTAHSHRTLG